MTKRKYSRPELAGNRVLYKSPRFVMFEVSREHPHFGYEEQCTVMLWDGLWDGYLSFGDLAEDGMYTGVLPLAGEFEIPAAKSAREFIDNAKIVANNYFKVALGD